MRPTLTGGRKVTGVTSGPKRMRSVCSAAMVKERYGSSESCCVPMKKWSDRKTPDSPASSDLRRMLLHLSQVRPFCPSTIRLMSMGAPCAFWNWAAYSTWGIVHGEGREWGVRGLAANGGLFRAVALPLFSGLS